MRRFTESAFFVGVGLLALGLTAGRAAADALPADKLPEPALTDRAGGAEGEYLRRIHAHVHKRWAENFLRLIGEKLPTTNPLNDAARSAEVDVTISGDGQLVASTMVKSSGFPGFDDAIGEILRDSVPFPSPPAAVRSDDDRLHLHWLFARDQRRCSGVAVLRVQDPLEISIPKLLRTGRGAEAIERVAAARAAGVHAEPMMSRLATDWMKLALHEPWTSARTARLMADRGDGDAIAWLKLAVKRPETAREAGEALIANKVAVCPLVKSAFDSQSWSDHQTAALALATSADAACAPGLIKLLDNAKARPEARAAAATALGPVDDEGARKALSAVAKDEKNDLVRAAAMLAQVRPNAGRGKVLAMVHFIRDPSPEIRAASAAGVVRAGGDSNLDDLYVLFKDNDARPSEATLRELQKVSGEKATNLVARLARRPQVSVEKLAAETLIRRRARESFSVLKSFLEPATDLQLRALALVAADDALLAGLAEDPKLGTAVYRAYLARGERDRAADWLLSHAGKMPGASQAEAMTDWVDSADPPAGPTADARKPKK